MPEIRKNNSSLVCLVASYEYLIQHQAHNGYSNVVARFIARVYTDRCQDTIFRFISLAAIIRTERYYIYLLVYIYLITLYSI